MMTNRFCTQCGAPLASQARFCVECGAPAEGGAAPREGRSAWQLRYAPVLVVLSVALIAGGAVLVGRQAPKTAPTTPGRGQAAGPPGTTPLPEGHPPITLPEEVKQAIRDLAAKATAAPEDLQTWKHLGEIQYQAGQVEPAYLADAERSYQHILQKEPDNLDAMRALGNVAFDRKEPEPAIGYYQRYLAKKPDDPEVRTDMGTMYLAAGNAAEALKQFDTVLKQDPKFFQAQFNSGIAYRTLGEQEKSMAAFAQAREIAPDERTRTQVDQLIAHLQGQPLPPAGAATQPGKPAVAAAAPGGFQEAAEGLFRQNPVLGPKVQSVEWTGATTAQVVVRDFPIDQMGADMRGMFVERMKGRIKEKKAEFQVAQLTRFELVDQATGKVLETITE
jgi:tetratricopeptide (TPR) repeat protein